MRTRVQSALAAAVIALLLGALALPALASAATGQGSDPTSSQYGPPVNPPHDPSGVGGAGGSGSTGLGGNVGPLPFTGFDVIAMAAVALTVTGFGLVLQRAVARRSTE